MECNREESAKHSVLAEERSGRVGPSKWLTDDSQMLSGLSS